MIVAAILFAAGGVLASGSGGPTVAAALGSRLLSPADLPGGWSAAPVKTNPLRTDVPCLSGLLAGSRGWTYDTVAFVQGTAPPALAEVLATGSRAQQSWRALGRAMARCRTATLTAGGEKTVVTVRPLSFPRGGAISSAYEWSFAESGLEVGADLVFFRAGHYDGVLAYFDAGPPRRATVLTFIVAAVAKAEHGSTARVPGDVPVASALLPGISAALPGIGAGPDLSMTR